MKMSMPLRVAFAAVLLVSSSAGLAASFKPGDKTVFHTHRFPITVFILEGAFTLELEGRAPIVAKAGQDFVEPPNVKMTGYNRSATEPMRLVIFYSSDSDTPFLDPIQ
jgi:quercetin dioxygenase-like cupin family protein